MTLRKYIALLLLCLTITTFFDASKAEMITSDDRLECDEAVVLYARGSGQDDDQREELLLRAAITAKMPSNVKWKFISVQKGMPYADKNLEYPAIKVSGDQIIVGAEAKISYQKFGQYRDSINRGKQLLESHFKNAPYKQCNTKVALAGYSQGAHLLGEYLQENNMDVSYLALFGDPKHNSKSPYNLFSSDIPWYRGNTFPLISDGLLSARKPYTTNRLNEQNRIGSWCYRDDFICASTNIFGLKPHSLYPERAYAQASQEIVNSLVQDIGLANNTSECNTTQDLVLAIDLSPTMRQDKYLFGNEENGPKYTVSKLFDTPCNIRVGVTGFGIPGQTKPQMIADFTSSKESVENTLKSLYQASEVKQALPTEQREGMLEAMKMNWRSDAQKTVIVVTDTLGTGMPATDPVNRNTDNEAFARSSLTNEVLQKSRELGGVEIYYAPVIHNENDGIVSEPSQDYRYYRSTFTYPTAGQVLHYNRCDRCNWSDIDLGVLQNGFLSNPVTIVPSIRTKVGQSLELQYIDSSGGIISAAKDSISSEWFLNCNENSLKQYGDLGKVQTFAEPQKCYGAILTKVMTPQWCNVCNESDAYAGRSVTPFEVEVLPANYVSPPVPQPIQNLLKRIFPNQIIYSWDAPAGVDNAAYIIKEPDGSVLGITDKTALKITDVPFKQEPEISVSVGNQNGLSEPADFRNAETIIIDDVKITDAAAGNNLAGTKINAGSKSSNQPAERLKSNPSIRQSVINNLPLTAFSNRSEIPGISTTTILNSNIGVAEKFSTTNLPAAVPARPAKVQKDTSNDRFMPYVSWGTIILVTATAVYIYQRR